jgi:undecaprenyl-diphosphatase
VLLSLAVVAAGVLAFAAITSEVLEGDTQAFDRALLLALRSRGDATDPIGPRWLEEVGRDLTALGGVAVLTLLSLAVIGYLLLLRRPRAAALVVSSVLGALALSMVLKALFGRPRPELVPHLSYVVTSSFPSGHAMLAAAVFLTLGALLARLQQRLMVKAYILLWAVILTLLVGVSRVYVGVHWPSDVLAGWAAGATWASLCWVVARRLQRRSQLERD